MTEYRLDRKRKLREDLERIANEEEAELEQLALDLEAHSQYQKAEVRLRTKDLSLVEEEDYEEAKKCVDGLLQKIEKTAKDRKEKRKRTAKFAAKVIGVTAAVLSLGYGVSRMMPLVVEWYDRQEEAAQRGAQIEELNIKLSKHLKNAADIDCDGYVKIKEFYPFYREATGKDFFNQSLDVDKYVSFIINDNTSIAIKSSYTSIYDITLPPKIAEQLLQEKGNRSCSITLE